MWTGKINFFARLNLTISSYAKSGTLSKPFRTIEGKFLNDFAPCIAERIDRKNILRASSAYVHEDHQNHRTLSHNLLLGIDVPVILCKDTSKIC